ncbi:MAG: hypothetical protein PHX87_03550 [Candidatus Peribacteraceae bacterium]|nr:hypothetical protein [Candidatus Peribacteraceae bacterium]MDD5742481.1 hypothetical protein [Candidatus Peribacteraceae bacterium]
MNTLYLTGEEKKAFGALPAELQEGWEVVVEAVPSHDDIQHRSMRLHLVHLHDKKLMSIVERARTLTDVGTLVSLVSGSDLSDVNDADLAELCFAIGPIPLTRIIREFLSQAKDDSDIEGIQSLATVRHSLISAAFSA